MIPALWEAISHSISGSDIVVASSRPITSYSVGKQELGRIMLETSSNVLNINVMTVGTILLTINETTIIAVSQLNALH